jgi:uncharacterized protein (TIGR01777 family)
VIDPAKLERVTAVIHLAGENLASRRWTAEQKARLRNSRVQSTAFLCKQLALLRYPPRVLLSASAVGFYGSRGEEMLTEESPPGTGFLAELCRDWEAAANAALSCGIRVVSLRFGIVLSKDGGALAKMLPPFRFGLGGRVGHGRQFWSWISLEDAVRGIRHAIEQPSVSGPLNLCAPRPVTNAEFTRTLGDALGRPAILPVPALVLRLFLGEMADAALLASARVRPAELIESGFEFLWPDLGSALVRLVG